MFLSSVLLRSQSGPLGLHGRPFTARLAPRLQGSFGRVCRRFESTSSRAAPKNAAGKASTPNDRVCIYHAGTGRITFLSCLKLCTILSFAFFTFVVTPRYYEKEGWSPTTIRVALSGVVPLVFVGWTTSPYVLFVHMRVPPHARQTPEALRRYLARLPAAGDGAAASRLAVTTMSPIAKPRVSSVGAAELRRADPPHGLFNFVRDVAAENATRRWYNFGAVGRFNIQPGRSELWDALAAKIPRA